MLLTLTINSFAFQIFAQEEPLFELESEGALLMDAGSGKILFEKNIHEKLYPASMTKIMTMLLVLESIEDGKISLEDDVVISENAAKLGGSQIFLSSGDVVQLESLMIGIAVGSGNDAAVAVAEHSYGSLETFAVRMNERALELGMKNTNFANPHGLHDENHYSTPYDVAIMSKELLKHPIVHTWFEIWMDENFLEGKIRSGKVYLSNTNKLIRYYNGGDGVKTGYTSEASHCISASAKRDDTRFIAIIMAGPSSDIRYNEARKLLDYGFANYESVSIVEAEQNVAKAVVEKGKEETIDIVTREDFSVLIEKGVTPEFKKEIKLDPIIATPIVCGDVLGYLEVYKDDKFVGKVELIATQDMPKAGLFDLFKRVTSKWVKFGR